jgi:UDP-N-acetyl-D-mannosaminuronic acid dehydrogenase
MTLEMNTKEICVIGLGYIGLPTGALLANRGYMVYGVDVVQNVVDTINRGEIHIIEPELDTFVRSAVQGGKLIADIKPRNADVFIIAVPTPFHDGYVPNIDYVISATESIAPFLKSGNIIILESTSPVGTTDKILEKLNELGVNTDQLHIAHCPERVLPGKVMKELIENDRIVGGINPISTQIVKEFYESFVSGAVLTTDSRTAEMCKLVENSYRDTNIAFANELSMICDKANINVWELIKLANKHPRVNILQPGAGVGGHCIAVDPWFIVSAFPSEAKVIKQARLSNDYKSEWVAEKIKNAALHFELAYKRKAKIAYFGLAFKPDIDDLRESPAIHIVKTALQLSGNKTDSFVVEPNIAEHNLFDLTNYNDAYEKADIIAFLVAHKEFKQLQNSSDKVILDFCGVTVKN